jgi:hypothetical protein
VRRDSGLNPEGNGFPSIRAQVATLNEPIGALTLAGWRHDFSPFPGLMPLRPAPPDGQTRTRSFSGGVDAHTRLEPCGAVNARQTILTNRSKLPRDHGNS